VRTRARLAEERSHQLETWIRARIAEIDADERVHYPTATVEVNAPLALIQLSLETQRDTYRRVLQRIERIAAGRGRIPT